MIAAFFTVLLVTSSGASVAAPALGFDASMAAIQRMRSIGVVSYSGSLEAAAVAELQSRGYVAPSGLDPEVAEAMLNAFTRVGGGDRLAWGISAKERKKFRDLSIRLASKWQVEGLLFVNVTPLGGSVGVAIADGGSGEVLWQEFAVPEMDSADGNHSIARSLRRALGKLPPRRGDEAAVPHRVPVGRLLVHPVVLDVHVDLFVHSSSGAAIIAGVNEALASELRRRGFEVLTDVPVENRASAEEVIDISDDKHRPLWIPRLGALAQARDADAFVVVRYRLALRTRRETRAAMCGVGCLLGPFLGGVPDPGMVVASRQSATADITWIEAESGKALWTGHATEDAETVTHDVLIRRVLEGLPAHLAPPTP